MLSIVFRDAVAEPRARESRLNSVLQLTRARGSMSARMTACSVWTLTRARGEAVRGGLLRVGFER